MSSLDETALNNVSVKASGTGILSFRTIPKGDNYRITESPMLVQVTYGTKAIVTITIKEGELKDLYAISVEALDVNKDSLLIGQITFIEDGAGIPSIIPIEGEDGHMDPGYTRQYKVL